MITLPGNGNWNEISLLQPRLRKHVRLFPQVFRGVRWYVLRDQTNGQYLRFDENTFKFIIELNGRVTVEEIRQNINRTNKREVLNRDEIILILNQLFNIEVVKSEIPTNTQEVVDRFQREKTQKRQRSYLNPLSIKIPLIDPDEFLNRVIPWIRPLLSWPTAIVWFLIVSFAGLLALTNFTALTASINRDLLEPENLLSMIVTFVFIKVLHEFAHAFAVKVWGGEVHEMGITLLMFAPIPYVDASATWEFRDKYKRILVDAIGILVELFIAALSLYIWLLVEPGFVRDTALNALLISSVSTLLFNANPLLRFDGYYVLQDLIEIPNLYSRSGRYYLYLIQHYLFALKDTASPGTAAGETPWLIFYGIASLIYRMAILVVIVLFLTEQYLFIGVALGAWAVMIQVILPLYRGLHFLGTSSRLNGLRKRAIVLSTVVLTLVSAALLFIPVAQITRAEGVVWVSEQAQVYAAVQGFVTEVYVQSGTYVEAGTPVLQMQSQTLESDIQKLEAQYRILQIEDAAELVSNRGRTQVAKVDLKVLKAELNLLKLKADSLLVRSKQSGTFILPEKNRLKGSYLKQGDFIGYVFNPDGLIVRAVVPQSNIGLIRQSVEKVEVRLAERLSETVQVSIDRETPSGSTTLPSRALGAAGGGGIAVRMTNERGTTASEEVFQLDLRLPEKYKISRLGGIAFVRFDHGSKSLAAQWIHKGRQLLLSRL